MQHYKCLDGYRNFNWLTGIPLADLNRRDAWLEYAPYTNQQ